VPGGAWWRQCQSTHEFLPSIPPEKSDIKQFSIFTI
jgi:hypothetical protein